MKLSNFEMENVIGTSPVNWEYHASVDVTTGFLLWKKTERRRIYRKFANSWCFVDSGEFTPAYQAEALERSWNAKRSAEQS